MLRIQLKEAIKQTLYNTTLLHIFGMQAADERDIKVLKTLPFPFKTKTGEAAEALPSKRCRCPK